MRRFYSACPFRAPSVQLFADVTRYGFSVCNNHTPKMDIFISHKEIPFVCVNHPKCRSTSWAHQTNRILTQVSKHETEAFHINNYVCLLFCLRMSRSALGWRAWMVGCKATMCGDRKMQQPHSPARDHSWSLMGRQKKTCWIQITKLCHIEARLNNTLNICGMWKKIKTLYA